MKKVLLSAVFSMTVFALSAETLFDQLCRFNPNWKKYPMQTPVKEAQSFSGDREYIQTHLAGVLNILQNASTNELTLQQKNNRSQYIQWLTEYRFAGNFPLNFYHRERIPVFIDENQTHCAVGYLMMRSGNDELANRIAQKDNYVWVKDLNVEGAAEWQSESGLSFEELKLIQGAYDYYPLGGYELPDRYATPQQPICTTAYFTYGETNISKLKREENIWCRGEGKDGVLNGKWEQNYEGGTPWIKGNYTAGKRSGDWEEYEHWENNKLQGTRNRYDYNGNLIEEINFDEGKATSKINYDLNDSLAYVRTPIDSLHVYTQVYNFNGELIACGHETIYNPSNLLWFQNIELTALNSAQFKARETQSDLNSEGGYNAGIQSFRGLTRLGRFNEPSLVQYKKEGDWIYYKETAPEYAKALPGNHFQIDYPHYANQINHAVVSFGKTNIDLATGYDSVKVSYFNNYILDFVGYSKENFLHFSISYYEKDSIEKTYLNFYFIGGLYSNAGIYDHYVVKETGFYNQKGERIGTWNHYNVNGEMYKTETYLIPRKEEEELVRK
jgi:hypothetical protein